MKIKVTSKKDSLDTVSVIKCWFKNEELYKKDARENSLKLIVANLSQLRESVNQVWSVYL